MTKAAIELFPPDSVMERSGLSGKALVHGKGSLAEKILFLHEYHCGKDAQQLLRLQQSDGHTQHEFTTMNGRRRGTATAERVGAPVVLTTTTDEAVYPDDETRFLSIWSDESAEQSRAIVVARAAGPTIPDRSDLPLWRLATSLIAWKSGDFETPPEWLQYVAEELPTTKVRVRRDWDRFLNLCSAIALCRGDWKPDRATNISFQDYCVAYRVLEPVVAATLRGVRTQEFNLAKAVASLNKRLQRPATVKEVAVELRYKESLVYKHMPGAVKAGLVEYEAGTRETNLKRVLANENEVGRFLPAPRLVLKENPEIGKEVRYVDPFTGEWKTLKAED
jgi:hypothetical protein